MSARFHVSETFAPPWQRHAVNLAAAQVVLTKEIYDRFGESVVAGVTEAFPFKQASTVLAQPCIWMCAPVLSIGNGSRPRASQIAGQLPEA